MIVVFVNWSEYVQSNIHVLMKDERRKEERSKQGQTNNKAKQHSTPNDTNQHDSGTIMQ